MSKFYNIHSAIILSTTYSEDEIFLMEYLNHLSDICKYVKYQYLVLPVLVFEKSEEKKKLSIQKKIDSQNLEIKPLLLINNEGKGLSSCRNYGVKNTNSKFIFILDTDDKTNPKRIINQLDYMESNATDIISGYMEDQNGQLLKYPSKVFGMGLMMAMGTCPLAHPTLCIRRESLLLLYDENLSRCEDFDLYIRYFLLGSKKIKVFKNPITQYNSLRSLQKDKANGITQIKIRFKYLKKFTLLSLILLIGIVPNIFRIIIPANILLLLRRKL